MKKRTRADVLKGIARALSSIYRMTGGKGREWRQAVKIVAPLWGPILAHAVRLEGRRGRSA